MYEWLCNKKSNVLSYNAFPLLLYHHAISFTSLSFLLLPAERNQPLSLRRQSPYYQSKLLSAVLPLLSGYCIKAIVITMSLGHIITIYDTQLYIFAYSRIILHSPPDAVTTAVCLLKLHIFNSIQKLLTQLCT